MPPQGGDHAVTLEATGTQVLAEQGGWDLSPRSGPKAMTVETSLQGCRGRRAGRARGRQHSQPGAGSMAGGPQGKPGSWCREPGEGLARRLRGQACPWGPSPRPQLENTPAQQTAGRTPAGTCGHCCMWEGPEPPGADPRPTPRVSPHPRRLPVWPHQVSSTRFPGARHPSPPSSLHLTPTAPAPPPAPSPQPSAPSGSGFPSS